MDGKREAECIFVDTFLNVVHSQFCDEEIQHQYFGLRTLRMKLTITPAMKRIVERVKVQPISLVLLVVAT